MVVVGDVWLDCQCLGVGFFPVAFIPRPSDVCKTSLLLVALRET